MGCVGFIDGYLLSIKAPSKNETANTTAYLSGHSLVPQISYITRLWDKNVISDWLGLYIRNIVDLSHMFAFGCLQYKKLELRKVCKLWLTYLKLQIR